MRGYLVPLWVGVIALGACGENDDDLGVSGSGTSGADGSGASGSGSASGGAGGSGGGESLACPDGMAADTSGLAFDGVDDHVTMGGAPALGLEQLTVEAWVRRDGAGQVASTGQGGLSLVPIAGKGRGESDGSNVDCNYAFGFAGEVLGADFEDAATGANHPITGTVAIPWGEWHHVAVTYDGTSWRLYVDGLVDVEVAVDATPRADSIQHFAIGAFLDSMGVPQGALHGAIDEVRVWDHARTADEVTAAMYQTVGSGTGLVGRWALDEADTGAPDSAGDNDGSISGATFVAPGAVLDHGLPPVISATPEDGGSVPGTSVELRVDVEDPDSDAVVVDFHVRNVSDEDDFTIVVLPDTQYYTVEGDGLEHYFHDQTAWIRENRDAYNILAVIHNGDIVDNGGLDYQWSVADAAMSTLETAEAGLPDGMTYGVCVGNHDQSPNGATNSTTEFNQNFGVARFQDRPYYGGHYADDNDENWFTFSAGSLDFVVVNLQFDSTPDPAVLDWARSIFEAHPEAFGILNTHYLIGSGAAFGAQGQAIYDTLRDVDNVQLMTCGHVTSEAQRSDTFEGNVIHTMLADYQERADGGSGFLRIWEFSPKNGELTVRTYSPTLDQWETDEDSEYTLAVDLTGAGKAFEALASVDPATTTATATFDGLEPGRTYEWYATISDCAHTVTTPVLRFTTP